MAQKIMVGMSGGVDSSVAAYLLLRQGYEVTGVTFKLWDDPTLESGCCSADDVRDAAFVCQQLGIPHYVINYKDLFRQEVVTPFAEEYLRGRTPNPCINCNRYIKFGAFSRKLKELGFDLMATGHYARCGYNEATARWELQRAVHPEKDQSYVLCHLTQEQLSMLRLPLGEYSKPEIRALAKESGLVVAQKPDSQDICFVPDGDYNAFLHRWTGQELPTGHFVAEDGTVLGTNKGIAHYTIGQRKGLGISLGRHAFVRRINAADNTVELTTDESRLFHRVIFADDLNWIAIDDLREPLEVEAKIRYAHRAAAAVITPDAAGTVRIEFKEAQRAPAPGQAVVFYRGDTVIGGGTITDMEEPIC